MTQGESIPDTVKLNVIDHISSDDSPVYGELDLGTVEDWPNILAVMGFKVGLSYTPKNLPFNWGGWLDKLRKY